LIFGVSGQDGAYLAAFLLDKGYQVWGTSRDAAGPHENLDCLHLTGKLKLVAADMVDSASVQAAIEAAEPHEIYNLAGQTSVSRSFTQPLETIREISQGSLHVLEAMRVLRTNARFFHAGSSECFGNAGREPLREDTPLRPQSPYGAAKAAAHLQVASYRASFGIFAATGILFNHESPLRPETFVTQKVIAAVGAISRGSQEPLCLGNIDVYRDWGWAPEYVEAMWRILQHDQPDDFIIATGESNSLRQFVDAAFTAIGRDSTEFLSLDGSLLRPTEIQYSYADASKIERALGWHAHSRMTDVIRLMLEADAQRHQARTHG
jgi:GDPmannose 4,6-dehydratase